ncbi:hypothetical protein M422DRAFT_193778 [Sphaerobolus stellatus SS14]|uniref:Alpha/beta-hydrolase n=1 Tax=Sphaerobolus stellatus (strain SS14) TaxID=990650 RepID=A0A0C9TTK3_SPHS4|nr:hypothetical protein M422DRAFT_193778 [Sphaerobolus stellatus SS14]
MPFVQVTSHIVLHYIINTSDNDVAKFDYSKSTILFMHPTALDVTWLSDYFEDPRLTDNYNLIAFDQRNSGKTQTPYSGKFSYMHTKRDSYVEAADLGYAFELLQLPPVHIFAAQVNSIYIAIRFALLFPTKCLSLCLAGVPVDLPQEWVTKAYADLIRLWASPEDLEAYEQACMEMSHLMFAGVRFPALLLKLFISYTVI